MTSQPPIRKPDNDVLDMVIVGSGFGGLCMAIKMRESGRENFVILEKDNEVGGTWRDNHYPGAACDVQSHLYSFSFEGKADWSHRYAARDEIQNYILDTTDKYGIRPFIRFNQAVNAAHFDEQTGTWDISTEAGDQYRARHFVVATGPLHVPSYPNIPGLDRFKGKMFHSARWDHSYDLKGKNVVSIGTGASAIQYVPQVAEEAGHLYVMQRTPAWVIPRDTRAYPKLEKGLFRRLPILRKLHRARLYWSNESRVWPVFHPSLARALQNLAKLFIRYQVKDKDTARKLTPDYTMGCKRILISNNYYPTFNRDNVDLVTEGVAEIRENSVITKDGRELPADCIILGTGFVVDPRIYMKDFDLTGRNGRRLNDDWQDASRAYMGITVPDYPNLYFLVGPNTGLGHNSIIFMIECQVNYIMDCLKTLERKQADYIDTTQQALEEFDQEVQNNLEGTVWTSGCQSWYQQADGRNVALWPFSTWKYWLRTRRLDEDAHRFVRCAEMATKKETA
jgi:cation diffusion facilitator CzcD-associated flavoprotein CzcO